MCSNRASSGSDGYSRDELAEMCRESHAAIFGTILWSKSSCQRTCCFRNTPWASKSEGTSCHVHWCKQLPRYKCCFCQATSHKGALSALADLFGEIDCFYVDLLCCDPMWQWYRDTLQISQRSSQDSSKNYDDFILPHLTPGGHSSLGSPRVNRESIFRLLGFPKKLW